MDNIVTSKTYRKCGETKSVGEFAERRRVCKVCRRGEYRDYYETHKKRALENARNWYLSNIEKVREYKKKYIQKNSEKIKQKTKEGWKRWVELHPQKEYRDNWRKQNPYKGREYLSKRRSFTKKNGGDFTAQDWEDILWYYDNTCLCCGRRDVELTVDHVVPIALGGANSKDNIQPLCMPCNRKKHTKIIDYRPAWKEKFMRNFELR